MAEGPDPKAQREARAQLSREIQRELTPVVMKSCVRIMRRTTEAKDFKAEGTGTLFSIAGLHFLVTAAHVFDGGPELWLDNAPANKVVTLVHRNACRVDEFDIAFVELEDKLIDALRGSMRFFTMRDVKLHVPPKSRLSLMGFPQELNVRQRYVLGYSATVHTPEPGVKYNPETQVLLRYDMSFSAGEDGTPAGLPDSLKGMSGCPVWWFDPAKPISAESMRLAAVQTCTEPIAGVPYLKLVKATRWFAVLAAMQSAYPDLLPAMQLYFGEEAPPERTG